MHSTNISSGAGTFEPRRQAAEGWGLLVKLCHPPLIVCKTFQKEKFCPLHPTLKGAPATPTLRKPWCKCWGSKFLPQLNDVPHCKTLRASKVHPLPPLGEWTQRQKSECWFNVYTKIWDHLFIILMLSFLRVFPFTKTFPAHWWTCGIPLSHPDPLW